jgi:hypothetical protein
MAIPLAFLPWQDKSSFLEGQTAIDFHSLVDMKYSTQGCVSGIRWLGTTAKDSICVLNGGVQRFHNNLQ